MVNLARKFPLTFPTYRSYENPRADSIYESPYYWWWYALTLNYEYNKCCESGGKGALRGLYKDFGDVRYEASNEKEKLQAFIRWWREPINDETRGTYLFAEPVLAHKARIVTDIDDAEAVLKQRKQALLALPLDVTKEDLFKMVKREINRINTRKRGEAPRSLASSEARYIPTKTPNAERLEKIFKVYEYYIESKRAGKRLSNKEIAKKVELKTKFRPLEFMGKTSTKRHEIDQNKANAVKVSKYLGEAKKIIENVADGRFP